MAIDRYLPVTDNRNYLNIFSLSANIYNREVRECLVMKYTSAVFGFVQRYLDYNPDS